MRSTMKVVTAAKACVPLLALLAASVADARSQGLIHEEFIRGDHHARWTLLSLKRAGQGGPTTRSPFHSDEVWRSEYLETPDSIYSDLAAPVALAANEYIPGQETRARGWLIAKVRACIQPLSGPGVPGCRVMSLDPSRPTPVSIE